MRRDCRNRAVGRWEFLDGSGWQLFFFDGFGDDQLLLHREQFHHILFDDDNVDWDDRHKQHGRRTICDG